MPTYVTLQSTSLNAFILICRLRILLWLPGLHRINWQTRKGLVGTIFVYMLKWYWGVKKMNRQKIILLVILILALASLAVVIFRYRYVFVPIVENQSRNINIYTSTPCNLFAYPIPSDCQTPIIPTSPYPAPPTKTPHPTVAATVVGNKHPVYLSLIMNY